MSVEQSNVKRRQQPTNANDMYEMGEMRSEEKVSKKQKQERFGKGNWEESQIDSHEMGKNRDSKMGKCTKRLMKLVIIRHCVFMMVKLVV